MLLYESHSVIHGMFSTNLILISHAFLSVYQHSFCTQGRPFPLKGRYYANIFINFEPTGQHENHNEGLLPPYILEDSEESRLWYQNHPDNKQVSHHQNNIHLALIEI
jgi:uncharacterized membrane protein YobD (UPF0266 family)